MTRPDVNSWLTALRIARREARRAKGRSALVIALIGLPVLALAFAAVTYDSFRLTPAQEWERQFGAADAEVSWWFDGPTTQSPSLNQTTSDSEFRQEPTTEEQLLAVLPPGSRLVPSQAMWIEMRTAAGIGGLFAQGADPADPIFAGHVVLQAGRVPAGDTEVALTREAAERLGATIGDTVRTADGSGEYTVVGMVEFPGALAAVMMFPPGSLPGAETGTAWQAPTWLWDAPEPVTWDQVRQLNQLGIVVRSQAVALDPPPASEVELLVEPDPGRVTLSLGILLAGLVTLEVVLLAGPAFAVGARRRQRDLALVAASGGTPRHLRRIVLADGVVLGLAGAVTGIVLGAAAAIASQPLLEEHLWQQRAGGYRVFPLALLAVVGLAVLTGVLAALVPAFVAARQPVARALAGQRGVVRSRKLWLGLGLAMIGLGTALAGWGAWRVSTNVVLGGLIVAELGLVLCTPALVGLIAHGGRFLPLSTRIALRDTARNRAAAAPAISAVMAAVAGGLALGIFLDSSEARQQAEYLPSLPEGSVAVAYQWWSQSSVEEPGPQTLAAEHHDEVRAALSEVLPDARIFEVSAPACPPDSAGTECGAFASMPEQNMCPLWQLEREPTVAEQRAAAEDERCRSDERYVEFQVASGTVVADGNDEALLAVLTGASGEDVAAAAATLRDGGVVVSDPLEVVDGSATVMRYEYDYADPDNEVPEREMTLPAYALTSGTGTKLTFMPPAAVAEVDLATAPATLVAETTTAPTVAQQDAIAAALAAIEPNLGLYVERGAPVRNDPRLLVLAGAAALVTLGAAGIATGLAAADRRRDLSTLGAIGASPRVRRLLALNQSGVIAGLGTLLGVAAGAGAALAVLVALNQRQHLNEVWPPPNPYPIEVPWSVLGLLLLVPLVAMLGAGLLTRSRLPVERRLL